ncbi:MAG: replicative DNA helicase [Candidatus Margulisbacteria bacterium]|nr:replicative DNA helicase [Candidatus Margulisiibacteriota bacterium]
MNEMSNRVPPQSIDAEQSILGALMISKDAIASVLGQIQPDDFYVSRHSELYKAILSLYQKNEAIDVVTIVDELNKLNTLEKAGGKEYTVDILNAVPTAANVHYYVDIVKEKSILRKMIASGTSIVSKAFEDSEETDELLNGAIKDLMEISKSSTENDFSKLGDVVNNVWDNISESYGKEDQILGVPTGFKDFDLLCSGFQPSDLIILAARPAMGKTTLAMNFALNAGLQSDTGVAVFSLEMPKEQLALRMLSSEAKVDMSRLRTANIAEQEYRGLAKALGRLDNAPIFIDDTPGISPMQLRAKCRRLMMEHDIKMVIIDYLQLMRIGRKRIESRFQEVSEIVREIKAIAKELNINIIALSQLSRDVEKRGTDALPKLSDLRESGEIEQTADMVLFIHRDDYYDSSNTKTGLANLIIAKQRNGPTGKVELVFRKDVSRFELSTKGAPTPIEA